ncbi:MAG: membrane protein insertase YidC [Desulfovibrio sp.]|jgi:YidC/Oxa1 family membrane protein insertase|nr:membrane protein insertase YidC [Desulfovibrio sp.]
MDNKRLALAIGICIVIFLGWNFLSYKMGWIPEERAPVKATVPSAVSGESPGADAAGGGAADFAGSGPAPAVSASPGRAVSVETPLYRAVLHGNGGILRRFVLKQYRTGIGESASQVEMVSGQAAAQAPFGILLDGLVTWNGPEWTLKGDDLNLADGESGVLTFTAEIDGVALRRELAFSASDYVISERLFLSSPRQRKVNAAFTFGASSLDTDPKVSVFSSLRHAVLGGTPPVPEESQYNPTRIAWLEGDSFDEENAPADLAKGTPVRNGVSWMGVMNNYFLGAVSMDDPAAGAKGRLIGNVYHVLIGKTGVVLPAGEEVMLQSAYFIGPKESGQLAATPNNMVKALDYGFFSVIARPLVRLLVFLNGYTHNYGAAVILMTVIIKLIFWPLSQKSYKSMNQMKKLQPMLVKIREKHKDDKEAMNREVMQLYKTYKVSPAGGCLPIVVQIPVFFGLYQGLLNAIELRHAPFIATLPFTDTPWLADLASPDPWLITPLVMGATMFLQQKLSPSSADPTQAKIMMFMPLIFTLLFLNFPAGLVVYWLVNNVISIGQQWWQLRRA